MPAQLSKPGHCKKGVTGSGVQGRTSNIITTTRQAERRVWSHKGQARARVGQVGKGVAMREGRQA